MFLLAHKEGMRGKTEKIMTGGPGRGRGGRRTGIRVSHYDSEP